MYLFSSTLGQTPDDDVKHQYRSAAAAGLRAEREWLQNTLRDCRGIRILRSLTKKEMGSWDKGLLLDRRLKDIPKIFERRRRLVDIGQDLRDNKIPSRDELIKRIAPLFDECKKCLKDICKEKGQWDQALLRGSTDTSDFMREMSMLLDHCIFDEYKFPRDYVLGREQEEIARARCALSEFKWRDYGPVPARISRSDCDPLLRRLCAARDKVDAHRRAIENKQYQIKGQRDRLTTLRCENWPTGVRQPPDLPRWCAEVKANIARFEQELSQLEATAKTLDDDLFAIGHEYAEGCRDFPGCTGLSEPSSEQREFDELARRRAALKAEHERRLAPPPLGVLPLDVLKRSGRTTTTLVDASTASLLQSVMERSRVLRPYIADKLRRIMVPKNFFHHGFDSEYESSYTSLHHITIQFGSAQEKELKANYGFYHPQTDSIHLRPRANVGHALHEATHKFASRVFRGVFGSRLDEGVTESLTDLVLTEQGLPNGTAYPDETRCANHFIRVFTLDRVARAYFQGDTTLATDVAARLGIPLSQLARLRTGDALCQRLAALRP